mgnify:FL=1
MKIYLPILLLLGVSLSPQAFAQTAENEIRVPFRFAVGKTLYETNCGNCHGMTGNGSKEGPPLMHKIYEPSHHGDASFYRAVAQGAKAHHWKFGDMKPIPELSERDVGKILPYVRWLQRQHGIQ